MRIFPFLGLMLCVAACSPSSAVVDAEGRRIEQPIRRPLKIAEDTGCVLYENHVIGSSTGSIYTQRFRRDGIADCPDAPK